MTIYGDGTGRWHSETMEAFASKESPSLIHIILDCQEAIAAHPENPKCAQYQDEIHYASMELTKRGIAIRDLKVMLVCTQCKTDHISACPDNHQIKGFDIWCWSCDKPSNKIEVTV